MRTAMIRTGGGERITVTAVGGTYNDCVHNALVLVSEYLEGHRVVVDQSDAKTGDWFMLECDLMPSTGGTMLGGEVTFMRQEPPWDDEDDG